MTRGLRALRVVAAACGALVMVPVVAVGGVYWRLTEGPLDVTGIAQLAATKWVPGLLLDGMTLALVGRDVHVTVSGLHAEGVADGPTMARATAALEGEPLLHLALRLREVTADGVRVRVVRADDGRLSVVGLPGSYLPAEPRRTPGIPDKPNDSNYPMLLGGLVRVAIHDVSVTFSDAQFHQTGAIGGLNADMRRNKTGELSGTVQAVLSTGVASAPIDLTVSRPDSDAPTTLHAAIGAVNPAVLAQLAPALQPLSTVDAPIAVTADAVLSPEFDLQHAVLHAQSGPGRVFLPKKRGGTAPADFVSLALDAAGDSHHVSLTGLRVVVAPPSGSPPTTVVISGDATRDSQHSVAQIHVALDRAQMADLGAIWPEGVGGGARPWLVENVPVGSVHDGAFDFALAAGPMLESLAVTSITGAMPAEDVTLYWLRPVPPILLPHVVMTMVDADTLNLSAPAAHQGGLQAKQILMQIWGMSVKDQTSQIDADIAAPIADVFALLQHPRLKLLSAHPLPISGPTGQSQTHLTVKLPLESKLTMDSVDIHAVSHLTDVKLPGLAAGKPLDQGVFDLDVTTQGLALNGKARVAGIASVLNVAMDFRSGPPEQVVQHVTMASRANEKALAAAGLDTIGLLSGTVAAKLDYTERRNGQAVLQASADLGAAALSTPLGWSKPAGPAASISAQAELNHGQLVGFDGIHAEGPGLLVEGTSEMVGGWPSILHVQRCMIGRTNVAGTLSFPLKPGDPLRVVLAGPMLDISGPLSSKTTFEPSTPENVPPGRPYQVDLRFERVVLSEKSAGLGPVTLTASGDDRRIGQARLVSRGAEQLEAEIEPRGETRRLHVVVGDMGVLLGRLGSGLGVDQGRLTLDGSFDDRRAGSPLTATANVARFGVHGVAVLGKVLQAMTLYGLVDALRGPGLVFDELTLPFTLANSVLTLREARAYSSSLGLTAQGRVDLRRNSIDLTGTIVPAYFFNSLLGRVPFVGQIFSPELGGGVFAATFSLRGPTADPAVSVNPLAALTPGALRGLFGLFN